MREKTTLKLQIPGLFPRVTFSVACLFPKVTFSVACLLRFFKLKRQAYVPLGPLCAFVCLRVPLGPLCAFVCLFYLRFVTQISEK